MAVVSLNHANGCSHLYGESMYIHTVVQQCECRIGVAEAIKRSVQTSTWAFDQPTLFHKGSEGLVDILTYSPIGQSEHRQRWCQTNQLKHQKPWERGFYEAIRERHSVRAESRLSLNVLRFERDLCELNRLEMKHGLR
jgi:hypothetical protein